MELKRADQTEKFLVRGYGPTNFRVAGLVQEGAVLVSGEYAQPSKIQSFEEITAEALLAAVKEIGDVEILLIGCGARNRLIKSDIKAGLLEAGVNVEGMDTGAAARTYNVLVMEDRRVAALLLPAGL